MSIFRNTFQTKISGSLAARQDAMTDRTPDTIQYLNSRNSYIRMTSSVNVGGSADLAKNNVLLGGTLNRTLFGGLKSGVGKANEAYSTRTPGGTANNRLGIRPMPGIVSMDIKSKSAYGSLREAVVNFQCWDIKQLEELELLYMRPGYTVLIEWGWLPYLDNNKKIVTTPPIPYDILLKGTTNRTTIFKALYDKSTESGGKYDAMFGYIKNYQWSARPDGGYDCQATVISTGEIIESLKVNYVLPDLTKLNNTTNIGDGFLNSEFTTQGTIKPNQLKEHYEKNILAGLWAEAYFKLKDATAYTVTPLGGGTPTTSPASATLSSTSIFTDKFRLVKTPYLASNFSPLAGTTKFQIYITLEAAFDVINEYVMPRDGAGNKLMELSTYTEEYAGAKEPLLCVAHPMQVSVDPTVCLIKSPLWYESGPTGILTAVSGATTTSPITIKANAIKDAVARYIAATAASNVAGRQQALSTGTTGSFREAIGSISNINEYQQINAFLSPQDIPFYFSSSASAGGVLGLQEIFYIDAINHLKSFTPSLIISPITKKSSATGEINPVTITNPPSLAPAPTTLLSVSSIANAQITLNELKSLPQYFFTPDTIGYDELGIIKNIFVNLDFLYKLSLDSNLEASDNKEKNEINLYKYIKSIMSAIQPSIGNVNNFEVHVDPIDNKARVIDVNFTGDKVQSNLFKLQVHNLNSVVRNYSLQSQIFPEQSSIIAIGSQAKGGQLGMQNNTMIDFNTGLTDRIIEQKDFGIKSSYAVDPASRTTNIASNLGGIIFMFGTLATETSPGAGTDINTLFTRCKSNLRDLIVYFQSITKSPGANRNIIPTKFSFEMDGIGGLVIGNLFTINDDILPKGYKGGTAGVKLAQTITGISHNLSNNNDWTTKIDALNIVLGDGPNSIAFKDLDLATLISTSFTNSLLSLNPTTPPSGGIFPSVCPDRTNRANFPLPRYPIQPTVFSSVPKATVAAYINGRPYTTQVKRSTMASFGIETRWGASIINNNANGMQTDGGSWQLQDAYITGVTNFQEGKTGLCRSFATYASWQSCMDHILEIMKIRIPGNVREITPANKDDFRFWAKNYAKNWIGNKSPDAATIATLENVYQQAMKLIP